MRIIDGEHIDPVLWSELVEQSPMATWFQTREAYLFFDDLSFLEAFAVAVESDGQLKGLTVGYIQKDGGKIKQFFSRRAIVVGGPLLSDEITDEELAFLLSALIKRLQRKAIFIETRNFNDYTRWRSVFERLGFGYEPHYDVQVDTTSLELVNSKLDRNRKRNIKKALDNGVVIDENPSADDLRQLYLMLEELYTTKVKTPLFPFEFFEKLRAISSSRFFVAKNAEGQLLGGLVCVALEQRAVYAWLACGDDYNYKSLSPSVMVNYAGVSYAAREGMPKFDFMGAGKPDDGGYGVRDFKLKFGGELVEYGRYVHVCNRLLFGIGKMAVKVLKKA
ncbi:MAG: GNAT family N-acetyltransferase [Bacteroidales bacterium]|nr:GNAT family N-acetyltransferase [Bacteroidales bacterium]